LFNTNNKELIMKLSEKPNRSEIYYKITNEKENHHGLQYRNGLVIDSKKFDSNPNNSCTKGGIYFTTKEYLCRFFYLGKRIRPVSIPEDAKVVLDPEGDKYRADKLFLYPRRNMEFYFTDLFDKRTFPKESYCCLAQSCSKYFDKWFDKKTFPKRDYYLLSGNCPEYFDKWFDKKTFPKEDYWYLTQYCSEHFDEWFDKETFPAECYRNLAMHYSEHFSKWFDKETFPKEYYYYLSEYCSEYEHIWKDNKIKIYPDKIIPLQ